MNNVDPLSGNPVIGFYMHSLFIEFYTVFVLLRNNHVKRMGTLSRVFENFVVSLRVPNNVLT